jgi:hypothetical protein
LPEDSQARQQEYDVCNAKVIRCLNSCLFGSIVENNEPTPEPQPELSKQGFLSRIWSSIMGR